MFKRVAIIAVSCGILLTGCGSVGPTGPAEKDETIADLVEAGFPAEDISVVNGAVYVGGDAHVPPEAAWEMLQPGEGSAEHYRTTNLIGPDITRICVNPNTEFQSISLFIRGLDMAIANYNNLGLRFYFMRGTSTSCSASISIRPASLGTGHAAGFPSNGRPYSIINIGTGLSSYNVDVVEHVITHSLGHTIGLRHTDYYNRSISCGSGTGGSPSPTGGGVIVIPGTPTTPTPGGSIMNTCFPLDTDGEFTQYDITALRALYR
ncbi:protease [Myxococcus sp. AM001]|nr:protease [Myxococcus sp. AM001]